MSANSSSDHISITIDDHIQHIKIQRLDKMNALTNDMYQAMADALKNSHRDESIKVNLISGEKGCFTAGNDIKDFLSYAQKGEFGDGVINFLTMLGTLETPLILAIDGPAVGIGTTMIFHADLTYATKSASFSTPFLDLGLVPEAASSYLIPKAIGHNRAYELLVLGETYTADQALAAGFINKLIEPDQLISHCLTIAKRLAAKPAEALHISKQLLRSDKETILRIMEKESEIFARQLRSKEATEAFQAFLNRSKKQS